MGIFIFTCCLLLAISWGIKEKKEKVMKNIMIATSSTNLSIVLVIIITKIIIIIIIIIILFLLKVLIIIPSKRKNIVIPVFTGILIGRGVFVGPFEKHPPS
jgi:uncharacterized membrane protein YciS (DUF1049 family)